MLLTIKIVLIYICAIVCQDRAEYQADMLTRILESLSDSHTVQVTLVTQCGAKVAMPNQAFTR